jgi:uncharacterized repeat protein (TIGR03803 family)
MKFNSINRHTIKMKYLRMVNKPISALLIPLLWTAAFALPAYGAQTGAVFTSLYSFTGTNDGSDPNGLVQGSDGNFYGTTGGGGTNNLGTVFKITSTGALTSLYSFTGTNDGANPDAGLVQGSDGNFYSTTEAGGTNGLGTVFKITTNGALTSLYSFTGGNDGAYPLAGLVQGSDGNFYGSTAGHAFYVASAIFKISTNGVLTTLYTFSPPFSGNPSRLAQGSDGSFYGTTRYGGGNFNSDGTVFNISTNGALTNLYSFSGNDGAVPNGLVQGSDGNFYGTTGGGGNTNLYHGLGYGTVFKVTTNGALTNLYSFTGGNDGGSPQAALVQGSDGNFYGTTEVGGKTNLNGGLGYGTVFTVTTNGTLTSLYSFGGTNDGANPQAALVQGSDGNFYGITGGGGTNNAGTVFRLTIVPVFQAVTLTNGARILTWSVEAGGTYQLQYRRDWTSVNWNNLSTVIATGATLSFTDSSLIDPWRVYRVKLLP